MKFLFDNKLKLVSHRSIVDPDLYVVRYTDINGMYATFSVTLHPVEYFERRKTSERRMARIEAIKNAKQ